MDAKTRKERTRLIYNTIAPYYARLRLVLKRKDIPTVLELMDIRENETVLDAGMGPGVYTFAILDQKNKSSVVGVDLSDRFVEIAKKKARKRQYNNATFQTADLENLPFDDETFNKIICSGVLLIIPNREVALKELSRVLKPGGKVVFVEPLNETYLSKELFYVFAKVFVKLMALKKPELKVIERSDFAGLSYFGEEELHSLLEAGGFRNVQVIRNRIEVYGVCEK